MHAGFISLRGQGKVLSSPLSRGADCCLCCFWQQRVYLGWRSSRPHFTWSIDIPAACSNVSTITSASTATAEQTPAQASFDAGNSLYDGHTCSIIWPLACLQDTCVAALSILVPLCHCCEQLVHDIIASHYFSSFAPGM